MANTNPNYRTGQIPSAALWNQTYTDKVDAASGTATLLTLNGGTFNGNIGGSPGIAGLWTFADIVTITSSASKALAFSGTGSLGVPSGTTAQRPTTGDAGEVRWNSSTSRYEFGIDGSWLNHVKLTGDTMTGLLTAGSGLTVPNGATLTVGSTATATFNNTPTFGNGALVTAGKTLTFQSTGKIQINASTGVTTTLVNVGNYFDANFALSGSAAAIGTTQAVAAKTQLSGTVDTSSLDHNCYPLYVNADNAAVTGAYGINGLKVLYSLGASFTSSRRAVDVSLTPAAANSAMAPGTTAFLTAYRSLTGANYNLGGTAGATSNTVGSLFGANFNLIANASYLSGISGIEVDLKSTTAATGLANRVGVTIHINDQSAIAGINTDAAFEVSLDGTGDSATDKGFRSLFQIGKINGLWPVDSAGWIVNTYPSLTAKFADSSVRPHVAAGGIDFWKVSFTTAAYRSSGVVLQDATAKVGPLSVGAISGGASIDASGTVGSIASVSNAGASYLVGDQLYDGLGGIILVSTVNGSGGVTAAAYVAGKEPYYYGSGPATVTPTGGSGNGAAVFNITWTAANAISIQPTAGGKLAFNAATPIVKPTGVAVTAAGIHAALVSLGLIAA